jgi:hypothetical protein
MSSKRTLPFGARAPWKNVVDRNHVSLVGLSNDDLRGRVRGGAVDLRFGPTRKRAQQASGGTIWSGDIVDDNPERSSGIPAREWRLVPLCKDPPVDRNVKHESRMADAVDNACRNTRRGGDQSAGCQSFVRQAAEFVERSAAHARSPVSREPRACSGQSLHAPATSCLTIALAIKHSSRRRAL